VSIMLLEIGNSYDGVFYINTESKMIEKVEVHNSDNLETNFPGSTEKELNYLKLEKIMQYYMMKYDLTPCGKDLIQIMYEIEEVGFFYGLKPSLKISVKRKL